MTLPWLILILLVIAPLLASALIYALTPKASGSELEEQSTLYAMLGLPVIGSLALLLFQFWPMTPSESPAFVALAAGEPPPNTLLIDTKSSASLSLRWLPRLILSLIGLGSLACLLRLGWYRRRLDHLVRLSEPDENGILYTAHIVPPFAWRDRDVVLPHYLHCALSKEEIEPIIQHEREHIRRRDSRWFTLLALIDAVFWFNPYIRHQTDRCRTAAEHAVDEAVVTQNPTMRKAYAASLIMVLKHTTGTVLRSVPAVFPPRTLGDTRMRIEQIIGKPHPMRKSHRRHLIALVAMLAAGQAGLAYAMLSPSVDFVRLPTEGKISSSYGKRPDPISGEKKLHKGIDFKAAKGTPVMAVAAGTVTYAEHKGAYGNLIEIDHGEETFTRYAQLDTISVNVGERVLAGGQIGTVGSSGRSTGPHLHFEVLVKGTHIDPATVLPLEE